jgi:hypothetical protein
MTDPRAVAHSLLNKLAGQGWVVPTDSAQVETAARALLAITDECDQLRREVETLRAYATPYEGNSGSPP